MSLTVVVLGAKNVPNPETFGKCDPYAQIEFQGMKKKTEVIKSELDPEWNESFEFQLAGGGLSGNDELTVSIFDWERVGRNRLLGTAKVPLREFVSGGSSKKEVPLIDSNQRPLAASIISLHISCKPPAGAGGGGGGGAQGGGTVVNFDDDEDEDEEDEEDIDVEDEEAGPSGPPGVGGVPHAASKKKKKKKRSTKSRPELSRKSQDMQIRVKVVQARQLMGGNLQPVVRITVNGQMKQTRIKKSTTSPWWDESFFFNFNIPPVELVDELVDFAVYNSKTLRSDALIGSFKCDVGLIYDEDRHALINKWVLLSDPEDSAAGAKGYLKISACVLGPGDSSPNMQAALDDEEEDIESNLLRPAGVQLRPATFALRIFNAQDIPRMDSAFLEGVKKVFRIGEENKELVDPYFVFNFAGKEVKSKIMYANDHPDWNQELRLGLQFPSMCERIKFQIKDWDRLNQDDTIASGFISNTRISSFSEQGFLPTFGPTYVNFYGSTREYSDLPGDYEDLNEGKGEGVAYRGRALVQLTTLLGELPENPVDDISGDDRLRVQKFMRTRKYRIHAAFLNADMISSNHVDAPIEFEVSIGNYGNKLDENVPACPSTTQPTNAVFDGCHYYFLPWAGTKPCVVVDCSWEDISWRLESLNILLSMKDRLDVNLERVKIGKKAKLPEAELAHLVISLLDSLITDCSAPLCKADPRVHVTNDLDDKLELERIETLDYIRTAASALRENATDLDEAVVEIEGFSATLKNLAYEPQNSMPDVVIWMIIGQKRKAYFRIPANELLYADAENNRGKNCGRVMTIPLKYPCVKDKDRKLDVPALLRVKMFLGRVTQESAWHKMQSEGELAVFAETYENQVNILGSWTNRGPTMSRPKWSDSEGRVKLKKEDFVPPPGWNWENEWYINPDLSMLFDKDAGHSTYMEDIYECHARNIPGGTWGPASRPWADVKGDEAPERTAMPLPDGWKWDDDWQIDLGRAVDEEGWEYCVEATMGGYGATEKTYHLCRRRRWVRSRTFVQGQAQKKQQLEEQKKKQVEGWEYAPLFNMKFHAKERTMDLVRRRRWHRKMVSQGQGGACFFNVNHEGGDDDDDARLVQMAAPRMFLTYKSSHKYQLRAYIYQARDVIAADDSGLSDPYARVSFMIQSMVTETVKKSLCPTWDQTLIFGEVDIFGNPKNLEISPPEIYIELFDHDTFGKPEFMGRTKAQPMVKLDPDDARTPVLQWHKITRNNQNGGELLAAFELIKITNKDLPFLPPKKGDLFIVPNGIRPVMQRTAIECLCWGVRNMKKFQLSAVTSPSIRFECGGHIQDSVLIKDTKRNPNFAQNLLFFDVMLPKEELYMPPMNVFVKDHRQFGRKPTVGVHVLKSLEQFRVNPLEESSAVLALPPPTNGGLDSGDDLAGDRASTSDQTPLTVDDTVINIDSGEDVGSKGGKVKEQMKKGKREGKVKKFFRKISKLKKKLKWKKSKGSRQSQDSNNNGAFFSKLSKKRKDWTKYKELAKIKEQKRYIWQNELTKMELDWWCKYYSSTKDVKDLEKCKKYRSLGYDSLELLPDELEKHPMFKGFTDFCNTFNLSRGKAEDDEDENIIGEFKGSFRVYPLPPDPSQPLPPKVFQSLPTSDPEECIVRIYIIRAVDLQPGDPNGLADPYVEVELGKKKMSTVDEYIPNSINPVFGRQFEMKALLPLQKDLRIRVKDYDLLSADDIIGETTIDLENRYLSKYRATCGLQKTYWVDGINQWRDSKKPKELLTDYCQRNLLSGPTFDGSHACKVGTRTYRLSEFEKSGKTNDHWGPDDERLALHILNLFPLVKEHVESRPIFNPLQPNIEQGRLHMWVDMFPASLGPPAPPFDISPRRPGKYELRLVVWNTKDVILDEESITGEKMSDIYVSSWMGGIDEKQKTDVHYRSLDGEGNFNWRCVFPFDYQVAEQCMVVKKKEHFWSLDETEIRTTPKLITQIWDNDAFSADDFLGHLELNLNAMPMPAKSASKCQLTCLPEKGRSVKMVSLFEMKHMRGFWPCYDDSTGERVLTGKVELELELVSSTEAEERPAGKGREEPNQYPKLEEPNRPDTSFLWFTSPWKTFKFILWRRYRCLFFTFLILLILGLLLGLFIYSFPENFSRWIVGV